MAMLSTWLDKLTPRYWGEALWRAWFDREIWAERLGLWRENFRAWRDDLRYADWRQELQPKNWRATLDKYQQPVTLLVVGGALLVISFSMVAAYRNTYRGNYAALEANFIDEVTGRACREPITAIPPLVGSSGKPTIVRGVYYSPDGGKTWNLAYLEKYTDQAKAAIERQDRPPNMSARLKALIDSGRLLRSPEPGSPWVPATSSEGIRLLQSVNH